jgi:hypothetical protein
MWELTISTSTTRSREARDFLISSIASLKNPANNLLNFPNALHGSNI